MSLNLKIVLLARQLKFQIYAIANNQKILGPVVIRIARSANTVDTRKI
jgi:hypothetical protein